MLSFLPEMLSGLGGEERTGYEEMKELFKTETSISLFELFKTQEIDIWLFNILIYDIWVLWIQMSITMQISLYGYDSVFLTFLTSLLVIDP